MLTHLIHAVEPKSKRWPGQVKKLLLFVFFFSTTGGCYSSLHAEDETSLSSFPLSCTFRLNGEGEKTTLSNSLLNPSNMLMRPDKRVEGFLLANPKYKGIGGVFESEVRFGYEYLDGKDPSPFENKLSTVNVNQLYYQASSGPFSLLLGRKKIRWGVGYSYSPTDLITQLKNPEDPEDRLNKIKGSDIVQVSYLNNSGEFDLVYFPVIDWSASNSFINTSRIGMRWYNLLDPFDVSLVGKVDQHGNWALGLNTSLAVGNALELHAEYLYSSLNNTNYPNPYLDPSEIGSPYFSPHIKHGANDLLLGGQVTFYRDWNLTLEYLFHGSGYTTDEFNAYVNRLKNLDMQLGTYNNQISILTGLQESVLNFSTPLCQHYLFGRLYHPHVLQSLSFEMYSFVSLADKSGLFVIMPKYTGSNNYEVYCRIERSWGNNDTEFGLIPEKLSAIIGLSVFLGR